MTETARKVLTPRDVGELFRVDPKTVSKWAHEGQIPYFTTLGGHVRFYEDDILTHLAERTSTRPVVT